MNLPATSSLKSIFETAILLYSRSQGLVTCDDLALNICAVSISEAIPFELIESNKIEEVKNKILDFNKLLPNFSSIEVSGEVEKGVLNGREIKEEQVGKVVIGEEKDLFRVVNNKGIILSIAKKDDVLNVYKSFLVFN